LTNSTRATTERCSNHIDDAPLFEEKYKHYANTRTECNYEVENVANIKGDFNIKSDLTVEMDEEGKPQWPEYLSVPAYPPDYYSASFSYDKPWTHPRRATTTLPF
jgi:hypothetical protein